MPRLKTPPSYGDPSGPTAAEGGRSELSRPLRLLSITLQPEHKGPLTNSSIPFVQRCIWVDQPAVTTEWNCSWYLDVVDFPGNPLETGRSESLWWHGV